MQVRSWLVFPLFACLTLTGCIRFPSDISSERVDVPKEARASVPELEGTFWITRLDDASDGGVDIEGGFGTLQIVRTDDNAYGLVYRDSGESNENEAEDNELVILRPDQPGVLLALEPKGIDETAYALFLRSRLGTWGFFPLIGDLETPIEGSRETYLAGVANRHGLRLHGQGAEGQTRLEGKIDHQSLIGLFSDPAFLGALRLDPEWAIRMFPAKIDAPLDALDEDTWWHGSNSGALLGSAEFPVARRELATPDNLVGTYRAGDAHISIEREDDGGYQLLRVAKDADPPQQSKSSRLLLLPTNQSDYFLGLQGSNRMLLLSDDTITNVGLDYFLVEILPDGAISLAPIRIVKHDFSKLMNEFVMLIRDEAARRHNLSMSGSNITGDLSARRVRDLFLDPQFQVGLEAGQARILTPTDPDSTSERRP